MAAITTLLIDDFVIFVFSFHNTTTTTMYEQCPSLCPLHYIHIFVSSTTIRMYATCCGEFDVDNVSVLFSSTFVDNLSLVPVVGPTNNPDDDAASILQE